MLLGDKQNKTKKLMKQKNTQQTRKTAKEDDKKKELMMIYTKRRDIDTTRSAKSLKDNKEDTFVMCT
jgi:hypothetical protein